MEQNLFSKYKEWKAARNTRELAKREEATSSNFYWLTDKLRKPHKFQHFEDPRGYEVDIHSKTERWSTSDGSYTSQNDAVRITVIQPLKAENLRVISTIDRSYSDSNKSIMVDTCVIDITKPEGQQRIGDMSIDYIKRSNKSPNELIIENFAHDSNDNEFGLGIGNYFIDKDNLSRVLESAYKIVCNFITKGELPNNIDLLDATTKSNKSEILPALVA